MDANEIINQIMSWNLEFSKMREVHGNLRPDDLRRLQTKGLPTFEEIEELRKEVEKLKVKMLYATKHSGKKCPTCNGTGRV